MRKQQSIYRKRNQTSFFKLKDKKKICFQLYDSLLKLCLCVEHTDSMTFERKKSFVQTPPCLAYRSLIILLLLIATNSNILNAF